LFAAWYGVTERAHEYNKVSNKNKAMIFFMVFNFKALGLPDYNE